MAVGQHKQLLLLVFVISGINLYISCSYYWEVSLSDALGIQASTWTPRSEDSLKFYVHIEYPVVDYAARGITTIAVGGAITSKGVKNVNMGSFAAKFQLFTSLIPTFCKTASRGYDYRFYLAYDITDPVFTNVRMLNTFTKTFAAETLRLCYQPRRIKCSIYMVECNYTGKPTWAQNDAMLEAYLDHVDYFYRINDDSKLNTSGWVESFISTLNQYNPPLVGVVGPNHTGGKTSILTYDFVHRTHVDIFGFYYPRLFTAWWADGWMTDIYQPNHSTKLTNVRLLHTKALGRRYAIPSRKPIKGASTQLEHDIEILNW